MTLKKRYTGVVAREILMKKDVNVVSMKLKKLIEFKIQMKLIL